MRAPGGCGALHESGCASGEGPAAVCARACWSLSTPTAKDGCGITGAAHPNTGDCWSCLGCSLLVSPQDPRWGALPPLTRRLACASCCLGSVYHYYSTIKTRLALCRVGRRSGEGVDEKALAAADRGCGRCKMDRGVIQGRGWGPITGRSWACRQGAPAGTRGQLPARGAGLQRNSDACGPAARPVVPPPAPPPAPVCL
jgi:hypothetical protein